MSFICISVRTKNSGKMVKKKLTLLHMMKVNISPLAVRYNNIHVLIFFNSKTQFSR